MARIIIEYDEHNSTAKKLIDFILSFDFFKVKEDEKNLAMFFYFHFQTAKNCIYEL